MSAPAPSVYSPAAKEVAARLGLEMGRANLEEFADTLLGLARADRDIVVVTSDSRGSGKLGPFGKALPQQIVEASARQDAIELRTEIDHQTNVLDHHVVDFPFAVDAMELIVKRRCLALTRHNPGFDQRPALVDAFLDEEDFFVFVRTDLSDVGIAQELSEGRNELVMPVGHAIPVLAQGLPGHFHPIEARHEGFAQLFFTPLVALACRAVDDKQDLLNRRLELLGGRLGERFNRPENEARTLRLSQPCLQAPRSDLLRLGS